MSDAPDPDRLRALEGKIRVAKGEDKKEKAPTFEDHHSQAQLAWRMVIEMVAGLLIGFGIGFGLDSLFETKPFLMLVFTLLGFAAGVRVMLRTAQEAQGQSGAKKPGADDK